MRLPVAVLAALLLCAAIALGTMRRVADPRIAFCGSTDEFSEFMPGLRLHALPLWNLHADIRSNFFKSLLYSPHGFGDSVFYYAASGALYGLGQPISDRNLWLASAVTNAALIGLVAWFALRVAGNPGMGYVATLLLALSPLYVFTSQTAFGRITFVPLVQMTALLLAWLARRRPSWIVTAALSATVLFIELTDGFYFGPVVLVFLFLQYGGTLWTRLGAALRDRIFWCAAGAIALGLGIDVALGLLAASHNTTLTLFGYVRVRVGYGGVMSAADLVRLWLQAFQQYLPLVGALVVVPCMVDRLLVRLVGSVAGALAVWLGIASAGVLKYYASATGQHVPGVGPLTAYPLALPSYLVVAWACGRGWHSRGRAARAVAAKAVAVLGIAAAALPMADQLVTRQYEPSLEVRGPQYAAERDRCAVVKAASVYVREHAVPGGTVFHLSDDMSLGVIGEFYYGLSYVGNNHTGERNRIVDFGGEAVKHRHAPEQWAAAYRIPHFTYYVEFLPDVDPFAAGAVSRLEREGAHVAADVQDGNRAIGRIWRFDPSDKQTLDLRSVAERWDRVGHLPQLFGQSLAGTAYHFGAVWPEVGE